MDGNPDQGGKLPRPDASCPADAAGGGVCPLNFCGQLKPASALPSTQVPQSGADSLCGTRICVVGPVLASRRRVPAVVCRRRSRTRIPFGMACSPDPGAGDALRRRFAVHHGGRVPAEPVLQRDVPQRRRLPDGGALPRAARRRRCPAAARPLVGMCTPESKIIGTRLRARSRLRRRRGLSLRRRALELPGLPRRRRHQVAGPGVRRPGRVPQRRVLRPRLARRQRREPRRLLGRVHRQQRLRRRPALRASGRRQQRHAERSAGRPGVGLLPHAVRADAGAGVRERRQLRRAPERLRRLRYDATASATRRPRRRAPPAPRTRSARWAANAAWARASPAATARRSAAPPAPTSGVNACPGTGSTCAQRGGPDEPISGCYEGCTPSDAGNTCSRASAGYACESPRARHAAVGLSGGQRDVTVRAPFAALVAVAVAAGSARALAQSRSADAPPPPPSAGHGRPRGGARAAASPAPPAPPAPAEVAGEPAASPAQARASARFPTADATPAASDHDAVVGHVGIEARRFDPGPLPLTLRAGLGCPLGATCDRGVDGRARGALLVDAQLRLERRPRLRGRRRADGDGGARHLLRLRSDRRPVDAARQLAAPGDRRPAPSWRSSGSGRARRTRAGARPCSRCAARWRRSCTSGSSACRRCRSGCSPGMRFQYESAAGTRLWSIGVIGDGSVWDALTNLYVRYYL